MNAVLSKQIDDGLNAFDFQKVQAMMTVTGWKWLDDTGSHVPSVGELRAEAKTLLEIVANGDFNEVSGGGLQARRVKFKNGREELVLEFVFTQSIVTEV